MKKEKEGWEAENWQKNKATRHMGRGTHGVRAEAKGSAEKMASTGW